MDVPHPYRDPTWGEEVVMEGGLWSPIPVSPTVMVKQPLHLPPSALHALFLLPALLELECTLDFKGSVTTGGAIQKPPDSPSLSPLP